MTIVIPHGFEPNYTLGFVKGLLANGVDPCVISSDTEHHRLLDSGVRSVNLRGSQDSARASTVKLANLIKYYARLVGFLYKNRKSVIHFTGLFRNALILFDGVVLSLCFRLFASRYIYTVHNVLPHSKENSRFFKWIYWFIYRIPETLVVHTSMAKKQLVEEFFVPDEKIIIISIGLNEEMPVTEITPEEARRRLGFNARDRIVLFFGKADEYKGLDILVEAFDSLDVQSTKLLISGWFPNPSYRQRIASAIEAARRKSDIYLREEFVPNEKVEFLFKSADVLALPDRNIYQSGVVFLCFSFGLPIVATKVGSLQEFVEKGTGIITRTNDAQGVADGLRQFFETQGEFRREEIAVKAQGYKWDKICRVLVPLYR